MKALHATAFAPTTLHPVQRVTMESTNKYAHTSVSWNNIPEFGIVRDLAILGHRACHHATCADPLVIRNIHEEWISHVDDSRDCRINSVFPKAMCHDFRAGQKLKFQYAYGIDALGLSAGAELIRI